MRGLALAVTFVLGGALAGCPTVELGDTPADIATCLPDRDYFDTVVWPDYIERADAPAKSCVQSGCHGPDGHGGTLRFETNPVDLRVNYTQATRHINCTSPDLSDLLRKPDGEADTHHTMLFGPTDPEVDTFLGWF